MDVDGIDNPYEPLLVDVPANAIPVWGVSMFERMDDGSPAPWAMRCNRRAEMVRVYAWAIPSEVALAAIAEFVGEAGVVEVGAGTGWWAKLLNERGVDVIAYDHSPPDHGWFDVGTADTSVAAQHPSRALMLCWPSHLSSMAHDAVSGYVEAGGRRLVYIGGQWTGGIGFHEDVARDWTLVCEVPIPQWDGMDDALFCYERVTAA